jgi:3',5'-cyclic AMP phosphodiesterase CpdA
MRVFALSDLHIDYESNAKWVGGLSTADYRDDVLILAGDVTDLLRSLDWCLRSLVARFRKVLFVPGNHELWVARERFAKTSLQKFYDVAAVVEACGASMQAFRTGSVSIFPLLGWYDYSFGEPSEELKSLWTDYHACLWPQGFDMPRIAAHFTALNTKQVAARGGTVITFSHFLPRLDLVPWYVPAERRVLDPVLGATCLEDQLRSLNPSIHVYGHSHINRNVEIDGVSYVNNAFGYPRETWMLAKQLLCIHEC